MEKIIIIILMIFNVVQAILLVKSVILCRVMNERIDGLNNVIRTLNIKLAVKEKDYENN